MLDSIKALYKLPDIFTHRQFCMHQQRDQFCSIRVSKHFIQNKCYNGILWHFPPKFKDSKVHTRTTMHQNIDCEWRTASTSPTR